MSETLQPAYQLARQRYAEIGVDTDRALQRLGDIAISLHCWQGDDVSGFEGGDQAIGGGLAVTGAYPGKARSADELRAETISAVSMTGGHLGAGLGVVELTTAIHYLFNTPDDILIWDVGHQCYPHKILTERRDRIRTIRQGGQLPE